MSHAAALLVGLRDDPDPGARRGRLWWCGDPLAGNRVGAKRRAAAQPCTAALRKSVRGRSSLSRHAAGATVCLTQTRIEMETSISRRLRSNGSRLPVMRRWRPPREPASRYLKPVVSTKPLSAKAKGRALKVLEELRTCMRKQGFKLGAPVVENLTLGRAFFGFQPGGSPPSKAMTNAEHRCERHV